jgi:hypothetical protein
MRVEGCDLGVFAGVLDMLLLSVAFKRVMDRRLTPARVAAAAAVPQK